MKLSWRISLALLPLCAKAAVESATAIITEKTLFIIVCHVFYRLISASCQSAKGRIPSGLRARVALTSAG